MMIMKDMLNMNIEGFLDSLYVNYKAQYKDPDLIWDRETKRYVLFERTGTLKEYIEYIKEHAYESDTILTGIYLDKEDDMGCSITLVRHYKMQDMTIAVSSTLDEFFIAPLLQYFRKQGFEPGRCGVVEQVIYEKEKGAL